MEGVEGGWKARCECTFPLHRRSSRLLLPTALLLLAPPLLPTPIVPVEGGQWSGDR